jgi:hypothetical protein
LSRPYVLKEKFPNTNATPHLIAPLLARCPLTYAGSVSALHVKIVSKMHGDGEGPTEDEKNAASRDAVPFLVARRGCHGYRWQLG